MGDFLSMLKKHGNRVIDYSSFFTIDNEEREESYDIDIWFFIPSHLNIKKYTKDDFFRDFSTYTRYSAPKLSLNSLNDTHEDKNPLHRLLNIEHTEDNRNIIDYELKTLLNALKLSSIQAVVTLKAMKKYSAFEAERNLLKIIERLNKILELVDNLSLEAPDSFKESYLLALEGISLRIDKTLFSIFKFSPEYEELISDQLKKQREFRRKKGFGSIATENNSVNNRVIYREHLIKKWSESIMYINMEKSKTQKGISHIFLGTAAAVAMLIAGIITLITAKWVGQESLIWFLIALVAYSLKDRFKDILKSIFLKRMRSLFSDRVKDIVTPIRKSKCGKSKERVSFPYFSEIKDEIKKTRFNFKDDLSIKQYQEDIIHYSKEVYINTSTLYKNHSRLFGIKEIIRFDFRRWFHKMDKKSEKCFIPQDGKIKIVKGEREYHFTMIIQIRTSREITTQRFRIVANNYKIKEIIKVS